MTVSVWIKQGEIAYAYLETLSELTEIFYKNLVEYFVPNIYRVDFMPSTLLGEIDDFIINTS